jgi:hypothetical protein
MVVLTGIRERNLWGYTWKLRANFLCSVQHLFPRGLSYSVTLCSGTDILDDLFSGDPAAASVANILFHLFCKSACRRISCALP